MSEMTEKSSAKCHTDIDTVCKLNDGRLSQKQVETSGSVQFEQLNWGRNLTDSCQKSALYAFAAQFSQPSHLPF